MEPDQRKVAGNAATRMRIDLWQESAGAGVFRGMRSFPLIQSTLSETQQQFTWFVERHEGAHDETLKTSVTSRRADDVAERRHVVRFPDGCIGHTVKEIQALQGRCVQLESTFEIQGPGIPAGRYRHSDVEPFVRAQLEALGR